MWSADMVHNRIAEVYCFGKAEEMYSIFRNMTTYRNRRNIASGKVVGIHKPGFHAILSLGVAAMGMLVFIHCDVWY